MKLIVVGCLLLASQASLIAQSVQGVVTGTIFDASGAVLPQANLRLANVATTVAQSAITNAEGSYRFNLVPPGKYTLNITAAGFNEKQVKDIVVSASQVTPVNVTLSVASANQSLEVQARETQVQTATSELATTVNSNFIKNIPLLERNVYDLAFMAPTVTQGMDLQPSSGGARQSGTAFLLNGADNNDNFSEGSPNIEPALESVAEVSLLTNSMSAQYGRAGGIIISAVQRSGSNEWHGVAYEFNRNRSFNSTDFFQNRQGSPNPKYIRNQFGGLFAGPIVKNKTFFAFAYDRLDERTGNQISEQVPTTAEYATLSAGAGPLAKQVLSTYQLKTSDILCPDQRAIARASIGHIGCINVFDPINTGRHTTYGKIDHNFSANDRIAVTANIHRQLGDDLYGGGHSSAQPISGLAHDNYHNLSLVETHVIGAAAVNELTIAHNRHLADTQASMNGATKFTVPEVLIDGAGYGLGINIGPTEGYSGSFTQDRWQIQDNLSWMKGKHNFKFGGSFQYGIGYRNWDEGAPGSYTFGKLLGAKIATAADGTYTNIDPVTQSNFQNDVPYFVETSIDPRTGGAVNAYRHYIMKDSNFFAQDDWKLTPRFTVNIGLRWERYGSPTEANGLISQFVNLNCFSPTCIKDARVGPTSSMWKSRNTNWGPRVGFAWDPRGSGKTSIRAGFGIFYDRVFDNVWSNGAWNPPFYGLLDLDASAGDKVFYSIPAGIAKSSYTPGSLPGPAGRVDVRTMDVALKDSSVMNYNFTIDRQLFTNYLVRLTYQGSQGRHLPVMMNLNRYDGMRYNATFADNRPNSLYTGFNYRANSLSSNYNSFITEVQKRMSNGMQVQFSYTRSKLIDYGSAIFTGESVQGSFSQPYYFITNRSIAGERGPGAFDHTNNYKLAFIYELPFFKASHGLRNKVAGGWQLSTFYQAYSGHPLNIYNTRTRFRGNGRDANGIPENLGGDYNFDGVANDHPDFTGKGNALSGGSPADGIFTDNNRIGCGYAGAVSTNVANCNRQNGVTTASTLFVNPSGLGARFGSLGRNTFRGPWFNGLDATLQKSFKVIKEKADLSIRLDALNMLNHPNFDGINTDLNSSQFGRAQILIGSSPARRLQVGARIEF